MKIELEQSDIDTITNEVITNVSAALVPKIQEMTHAFFDAFT